MIPTNPPFGTAARPGNAAACWLWSALLFLLLLPAQAAKPRLIVLTDIGGDPDDQQSMVRLMVYANEFKIEGLIASASGTPGELGEDVAKPELIRGIVEAYGQVRDNLMKHQHGFPTPDTLLGRIKSGNPKRGMANIGPGHDTEGSNWIIEVVDADELNPVNIAIWGGSTDLAQALWRVREDRSFALFQEFVSRIRVHAISHQDDTGPWILKEFPDLFYVLSKQPEGRDKRESVFRGMYLGGDQSLTSKAWIDTHVRRHHGPLGALYPDKTWTAPNPHSALKEGDTPSWFFFLQNGVNDPDRPEWGGWGGRFRPTKPSLSKHYRDAADIVDARGSARATVWRWRSIFQRDFQARMDWCVAPAGEANHPPEITLNGDIAREPLVISVVRPGELILDASGSKDPDDDALKYKWTQYLEAGIGRRSSVISLPRLPTVRVVLPEMLKGESLHFILEVTDSGSPPLTSCRRVVLLQE